jgi:hypothetical protein
MWSARMPEKPCTTVVSNVARRQCSGGRDDSPDAWSTRALLPRIALNVADAVKTTGVAYIQHGSHSGQATKGAGHAVLQLRVYQYQYQYKYKLRIIIRSREQVSFTGGAQCITSGIARVLRTVSLPSPPMRSMLTACDIGCCSSEVM